nr:hypothetical protein BdHM001_34860 [Bdellovibrio sp. HM001]
MRVPRTGPLKGTEYEFVYLKDEFGGYLPAVWHRENPLEDVAELEMHLKRAKGDRRLTRWLKTRMRFIKIETKRLKRLKL